MPEMVSIDLGAQSGRVSVGSFDGERLRTTEVHRFANAPVRLPGALHWNVLGIYAEILDGLRVAAGRTEAPIDSLAVDSWAFDFGLIDDAGRLLQNPVHHRDPRTEASMEEVWERIPPRELYERTGTQMMRFNTLYQLWAIQAADDPVLERADELLLVPDLVNYWLCGVRGCELTNATTMQCLDLRAREWAWDVLHRAGIPTHVFGELVSPGTVLGGLRAAVAQEAGLAGTRVVAAAEHDTAAAVAAVPLRGPGSVYISSGTWSLVGVEVAAPVIDDRSFAANLTNEGGVRDTVRLLRNVTGLWMLHECARSWSRAGVTYRFDELVSLASSAPALGALVDPNDVSFVAPDDMPRAVREYCVATAQEPPEDPAAVVRCILESLALKYRQTIELLAAVTGVPPLEIHVVGGGAQNGLLNQWTADATGLPLSAGPVEATTVGNLLVQAMALGELDSLADAREVVRSSFTATRYEPHRTEVWEDAYARFTDVGAMAAAVGGATV